MEFIAEVKRTSQRKAASLDNVYEITFATDNPNILDLGKLSADTIVKITVDIDNEPS
jgi:hypothetical protein